VIPVRRPDLEDQEAWRDWRREALEAIAAIEQKYDPETKVAIRDELYKRAMPFLLRLFNDKCAYCEGVISSNQPETSSTIVPRAGSRTKRQDRQDPDRPEGVRSPRLLVAVLRVDQSVALVH